MPLELHTRIFKFKTSSLFFKRTKSQISLSSSTCQFQTPPQQPHYTSFNDYRLQDVIYRSHRSIGYRTKQLLDRRRKKEQLQTWQERNRTRIFLPIFVIVAYTNLHDVAVVCKSGLAIERFLFIQRLWLSCSPLSIIPAKQGWSPVARKVTVGHAGHISELLVYPAMGSNVITEREARYILPYLHGTPDCQRTG